MRRALIVGIDDYPFAPLAGCVNDAHAIRDLLAKNDDGSPNFDCKTLTAPDESITRSLLRERLERLFADEADVALFYFSGHGTINNLGGYLVTPDADRYDEGVAMRDIIGLADRSKAREVVLILDCCHSGALGDLPEVDNKVFLRQGISVLTGSRASQVTLEVDGSGLFTSLVCDALGGGASDVIGNVTVANIYAYVDQVLGPWDQRPLFKSHVSNLIPLRQCKPQVELELLRLLPKYFPTADAEFALDPSFEPDAEPKNEENQMIFGHLQKFRAARLLVPVGEDHMYFAAMNRKSCRLTELGRFYWRLANGGRL